jgi:predicted RNA-binding Zn-ribbon protein involved in translation (DUF1610 family)
MRISQKNLPFISIILLAFVVLFFSLWDIMYHEGWLEWVAVVYGILFLVLVLFLVSTIRKKSEVSSTVEAFEKSLKGKLHHFKCQNCQGIFAIKKSKHNNKKAFTLTCPDCGTVGLIPSKPQRVIEEVPEKKSVHKNFKCGQCGEWIMVWAEGANLVSDLHVYSCPYCGTKKSMRLS